ncbi:hypothetical protein WN943_003561 [Citrus x changshan-huyou]
MQMQGWGLAEATYVPYRCFNLANSLLAMSEAETRGRDVRKRPRGAESNHAMHAQREKILPRGGAAAEELCREERERCEGEAQGREARATV